MNNYPPQLPPPPPPPPGSYNLPPGDYNQPSGGYNPFNPYNVYDQAADYIPWLPGRQGPRWIPIAIILSAVVICSCCSFLVGTVFGIELPGLVQPSSPPPVRSQPQDQPQDQPPPEDNPTPDSGGFNWRLTDPVTLHFQGSPSPMKRT